MHGVPVARTVVEQESGGFGLAGAIAHCQPLVQGVGHGASRPSLAHQSRAIGNSRGYTACFSSSIGCG